MPTTLTHLECSRCKKTHPHDRLQNLCSACGKPLLARYDLKAAAKSLTREALARLDDMARTLLANAVIEDYRIEITPVRETVAR